MTAKRISEDAGFMSYITHRVGSTITNFAIDEKWNIACGLELMHTKYRASCQNRFKLPCY